MSTSPPRKKPGPVPKGFRRHNIFLPDDLTAWAKRHHPRGMSALIRYLLEKHRECHEDPHPR